MKRNIKSGYWEGYADRTAEAFHDACDYLHQAIFEMQRDGKTSDQILDFIVRNRESIRMRNLYNERLRKQHAR